MLSEGDPQCGPTSKEFAQENPRESTSLSAISRRGSREPSWLPFTNRYAGIIIKSSLAGYRGAAGQQLQLTPTPTGASCCELSYGWLSPVCYKHQQGKRSVSILSLNTAHARQVSPRVSGGDLWSISHLGHLV